MIALDKMIVWNSIICGNFTVQEYPKDMLFFEAAVRLWSSRKRPILIIALSLVAESSIILSDSIFQSMKIS